MMLQFLESLAKRMIPKRSLSEETKENTADEEAILSTTSSVQVGGDPASCSGNISPATDLRVPPNVVIKGTGVNLLDSQILVEDGSELILFDDVQVQAEIVIKGNSRVVIGRGSTMRLPFCRVTEGSEVTIGEYVQFESPDLAPASLRVHRGIATFCDRCRVKAEVLVRFGGRLSVGEHSLIQYGSEVRCEELVEIGSCTIISYDVCIYDTDTHSTDWRKRREIILAGYPDEVERPATKPVRIGNDVWIGKGATVTKGARIGDRCRIGIRTSVGAIEVPSDSTVVAATCRIIARPQENSE